MSQKVSHRVIEKLSKGQLSEAINLFLRQLLKLSQIDRFLLWEAVTLSMEIHLLENDLRYGLITYEEVTTYRQKFARRLLHLLEKFES